MKTKRSVLWLSVVWGVLVLLLFLLLTSDGVRRNASPLVVRLNSSFRSRIPATRSTQCRTIFDAVLKFTMELVVHCCGESFVFCRGFFPTGCLCFGTFPAAQVTLCRAEGFVELIICHSASPFFCPSFEGALFVRIQSSSCLTFPVW